MMPDPHARLRFLNISLPEVPAPVANYLPVTQSGSLLLTSGQIPLADGALPYRGRLGEQISLKEGIEAAHLCFLNILAHLNAFLENDLGRVRRLVSLNGFVASAPDFTDQPKVMDGASDLAVAIFGNAGKHVRTAVGVVCLPLGAPVEIQAAFEIRPASGRSLTSRWK